MATDCDDRAHIGPAHVDNKIVQEVLRSATGQRGPTARRCGDSELSPESGREPEFGL